MERKMKDGIIILAMIFGVNSCSTSNVALGVLGGLAVVTAMNSKGSSNYKGTKRVCTAYSDSYGGVRQCLNWSNEPVYE